MAKKNSQKRTEAGVTMTDPEFTPPTTRKRRHLTAQYKLRILGEIDALPYGQTAAYLRRERLYSSQIATWRKQRETGKRLTPRCHDWTPIASQ